MTNYCGGKQLPIVPTSITPAQFSFPSRPARQYCSVSLRRHLRPLGGANGLYQILGQDYQVTLHAIAQAGKAKVLSRPSILARNNQPATIQVGQQVPLITGITYDSLGNQHNAIPVYRMSASF